MYTSPLIKWVFAFLSWFYDAERHTLVKRNLCAVLCKTWLIQERLRHMRSQKMCSKGVYGYETLGTSVRDAGDEVEKMDHFRMNQLKLCAICSDQKKTASRARRRSRSFGKGAAVSSSEKSLNIEGKCKRQQFTRLSYAFVFFRFVLDIIKQQNEFLTWTFYECSLHAAGIAESHRPQTVWPSNTRADSFLLL